MEEADGLFFLTMELVEGRSLAEALPKGGLPLDRLLRIAIPVADAIAAAHQKGITHRDLKPGNIMLGEGEHDGRVKVLDFGLAKLADVSLAAADRDRAADRADHRRRAHPRHGRLHVAGAGRRQADRRALGPLLARRDPV